ncbi:hypothetical protein MASR1M42_03610 [Azonexus hydrophilus]
MQDRSENLKKLDIQAELAERRYEHADELEVTKRDVMAQVLEAIEMGRQQQRPDVLAFRARWLRQPCGFEPGARQGRGVRLDMAAMQHRFASMSDAELPRLASGGRA